ncbi:internal scaffolding protein [Microviridae sp.]|nr:internal scaffolding protein [Microviridae sp.]
MSNVIRPRRVAKSFKDTESMTEQCHKDEVSIQNIMRKHRQTGVIQHVAQYQGQYMDMVNAPDFHEYQNILAEARSMFETVPSHIRKDFDNDPQKFLEFMQNAENIEAIEEYGLDASHLVEAPTDASNHEVIQTLKEGFKMPQEPTGDDTEAQED